MNRLVWIASLTCLVAQAAAVERPAAQRIGPPPVIAAADQCGEAAGQTPMPIWPKAALRAGTVGWAVIRYDLDGSGRARQVGVAQAEPEKVFHQSAINTVAGSRFKAGVVHAGCLAVVGFGF